MDTNQPDQPDQPEEYGDGEYDGDVAHDDLPTAPLPEPALPLLTPSPSSPPPVGKVVTEAMKARAADPTAWPADASFLRRHTVGIAIAAAVLAVVVVAGGTAWGVSAAVAAAESTPTTMSAPVHATKAVVPGAHKRARGLVGTVTAISGTSWTISSAAGVTVTVAVGPSTTYSAVRQRVSASSFAVGDRVGVFGTRLGDAVTATRIVHLVAAKHTAAPTPTATPTS